jgi:YidC/Oxa1 family membrane protein insertase
MQQKNLVLFIVLSLLILLGSIQLQKWLWPQQAQQPGKPPPKGAPDGNKPKPEAKRVRLPKAAHPVDPGIQLGDESSKIRAILDPWGAGLRSLTFKDFKQANELGRPEVQNGEPVQMELIQAQDNLLTPSFALYLFDPAHPNATRPVDTLGKIKWDVLEPNPLVPGQPVDRVVFAATVGDVRVTKIFTLGKDDYHIGLEVRIEQVEGKEPAKGRTAKIRYQIAGAQGLRMEGEWYTGTHRDALILLVDPQDAGQVQRTREDLRSISLHGGGDEVTRADKKIIRYVAVITQYFSSAVVVDNQQEAGVSQDFIDHARPTLERAWLRGRIESIALDGRSFEMDTTPEAGLFSGTPKKETHTIVLAPDVQLPDGVGAKSVVAVNYTYDEFDQMLATKILGPGELNRLYFDDITVRLTTRELDLTPGKPIVHRYLLYNGPVKVRLLADAKKDAEAVPAELVKRYDEDLRLDTFTDYQSNGPFGAFAGWIGWTRLLIICTNFMHSILWGIYYYLGLPFGLCIILLTLVVRAAMFPLSRKQTLAAQRMQDKMAKLKPEIEKLKEKHKNDPQGLKQAQTELMLRHGMINPLGSCWVMLLQMPIFMGLYFCLQESIHFRLAPFAWIENLAAPDMLIYWGQSIPLISSPSNYSGGLLSMLYLGPFFNLLPIIAVAFMIVQQSLMMPPPTDEQTAMQQKMMKYMTVFFGLLFYKVAAGLCIYFIISSVWGYCERKLLPKKQPVAGGNEPEAKRGRFSQWMLDRMQAGGDHITARPPASNGPASRDTSRDKRDKTRRGQGKGTRDGAAANSNGMFKKIRAWWQQVLKEARKK